ncbi:levanbiose-producing levanase [Kitasatospora gansuensis]|uniref:Levanbiose-producing levanase n=1 Tax=Kitasatospora gansuensis TaxID=258050 RepID=A0A7W7S7T6_9ACTN|nr:glycoside hydrolase family 32 protein [Kitasatospora gansuensis]MBB4945514.1 levanbiose-producing levanase [Kitasatospora gansuensis]
MTSRLRFSLTILLGLALTALGVAAPGPAGPQPARAADSYRSVYHFTVPDHWKNDPQRPVYVDGAFHYYYLYNADYDQAVGTAWRLATTTDNVAFHDQGVAAPKKSNANYDLWSGSAVVDTDNTAGFGAGAIVVLTTQMDHPTPAQIVDASGPQAQFLWYSTDGGRNFRPYGDTPVMANGGRKDFRDPKVVWDAPRNRWVALLAEGDRIGFYTSPDLKNWTWASSYVNSTLGTLECPDLFQLKADDGTTRWVMGASANGYLTGAPNTYAYWVGTFDGTAFTPDTTIPQWLDHGLDWYGGVTWEDPTAPLDRRYAIAWMNNWSYPYTTPTWAADGFNGTDSITRQITLKHHADGYALASRPVPALDNHATGVTSLGTIQVNGRVPLDYHGTAYQLEADVSWSTLDNLGIQLRVSADGTRHVDAGINHDYSYLNRRQTGNPDPSGQREETHAPYDPAKTQAHLRILVDRSTVEYFLDDGRYVHSSLAFPDPADNGISLFTSGGSATFANVTVTEFANLAQRPARTLADFEGTTYGSGWTTTGGLTGTAPTPASLPGQVGAAVLDTYAGTDSATGTITSPAFTIDRDTLHLLVAGGRHPLGQPGATAVNLLVDGLPVRTATGDDTGTLKPVTWDLSQWQGRSAQLQILDDATGGWGHLMLDQVTLSD